MPKLYVNKPTRLRVRLFGEDGVTTRDGVDVFCTVKPPRGPLVTYTPAQITHSATGVYSRVRTHAFGGQHVLRWYETIDGVVVLADKVSYKVEAA